MIDPQTLTARLCHDIASPLGTMSGMLELIAEGGDTGEAVALAQESIAALAARLRLLRVAWGGGTGPLGAAEFASLAAGAAGAERWRLDLGGLGDRALAAEEAQAAAALLIVAGEALPRGGSIRFARSSGSLEISLDRGEWPEILAGPADCAAAVPATPRAIAAPMARAVAEAAGLRLELASPGCVRLRPA